MAFVVVYDACVLYPNTLRDLLIRLGQARLVQAKWTDRILDEVDEALTRELDIPPAKLARRRALMNGAVRDCLITGYEPLMEGLKLPDPDDRHVLAAAVKAGATSLSPATSRTFRPSTWRSGRSRPSRPMTSSWISSTSTTEWSTPASRRSRHPGGIRRARSTTCWSSWSGPA